MLSAKLECSQNKKRDAVKKKRRVSTLNVRLDFVLTRKLNDRPMRRLKKSRRELFEEMERVTLKPLPERAFELSTWARPKVAPDYHVAFDDHFYSVHFGLIGQRLDLRATETTIEIFRNGKRINSYPRSYEKWKYTTRNEHMPRAHRDQARRSPRRRPAARVDRHRRARQLGGELDSPRDAGRRHGRHAQSPVPTERIASTHRSGARRC